MSDRSRHPRPRTPLLARGVSSWIMLAALGLFAIVQSVLPALHAGHQAQHRDGSDHAAAIAWDSHRHADASSGAVHPDGACHQGDDDAPGDDCDVCKSLLLAKSIGAVWIDKPTAAVVAFLALVSESEPDRPVPACQERPLAARGPPIA